MVGLGCTQLGLAAHRLDCTRMPQKEIKENVSYRTSKKFVFQTLV